MTTSEYFEEIASPQNDCFARLYLMRDFAVKLETERDELRSTLQFVERMANHHGQKPFMTAEETLSWIQHHPGVTAITESYSDGKFPETPSPWKERDELRADLAAMTKERDTFRNAQRACAGCEQSVSEDEFEQLKIDKLRMDWMQNNYTDTEFISSGEFGEGMLREAIDEVMKPTKPTP